MTNPYRSLELLAPAGNMACLHAAVRAGADAVYLGCEDFNARRGADNFTLDNLAEACDYAHLRGVSIYMTVNVAVLPDEANCALELVRQAWRRGVDAFIVQDIGLARELRRVLPQAKLHISTQMNTHDVDGIRAVAALGASRVTLARELTLLEVAEASAAAHEHGMTAECFGHGALCVCYSGQCFMSSLIGGRSANRGMCAQACRLPYSLHNAAVRNPLPSPGEHLLSPKDLCTIDTLVELGVTGVDSVKIEGRMKSPEYVFTVVGVYRAVLDRLAERCDEYGLDDVAEIATKLKGEGAGPTEDERRMLTEAFSRGFTEGYLKGRRGNDIMSYGRPNNRGVFVGRVAQAKDGFVSVASEVELHEGDVLEFWTGKGHFAHTLESVGIYAGQYRFPLGKRVGKGDRVFRVRDASLAFSDDVSEPKIAVRAKATLSIGKPLTIEASCARASVCFEGPVIEAARTKAVTSQEAYEHIDRLGNTPFVFESLDVNVDEGVGIGFSALHKARTQALKRLEEAMLSDYRERKLPKAPERIRPSVAANRPCSVVAFATNPACARAAKRAGADAIYVPVLNYRRGEACVAGQLSATAEQAGYPGKCIMAMPVVDKASMNNDPSFDVWDYAKPGKPLFVENFGQLVRAREEGMHVEVGPHVPVTNAFSLQVMADMGVERVWLSPELTLAQIEKLGEQTPVALGLTVSGYQELMTTEHCLLMSQGPCDQRCSECARRKSPHFLEDRKGYQFQVVTDSCGRSHLYNAVQLDAAHLACDLIAAGVSAFMVDTTLMNVEQTTKAVSRVVRARDIAAKGDNSLPKAEGCTTGHLFRGVR
ncbi:MAG: DUF3656 domain-containing protein [Slackia sp.]|nr:DUF3656 domain-containing protein [Slackia sp.]